MHTETLHVYNQHVYTLDAGFSCVKQAQKDRTLPFPLWKGGRGTLGGEG